MNTRYGWWIMIVVLILLGGRTFMAARSAAIGNLKESKNVARADDDPLLTSVDRQDSLLAVANRSSRDPFRAGSPPPMGAARTATVAPEPGPVVPPRVAVLMDTGSGVIIQIEVDGETSPRLPVGGTFRGWTVGTISATTVTILKGGEQFTVPRP